jgi:signal transduction histidine kinase
VVSLQATGPDIGLEFYGKMSASVSHEIKNCLAIINENAGLLEDLSMLAEQGMPVDPGRLQKLSQKLKNQVRRANQLVLNLNRLAHSSDLPFRETYLGDSLGLMCALAQRSASRRGVTLHHVISDRSPRFVGYPFRLNHLIWQCLEYAIRTAEEGSTVELKLNAQTDGILLLFKPVEESSGSVDSLLIQSETMKALLAELKASVAVDREKGGLELAFESSQIR